jgi:hypothetical protein
MEWYSKSQVLLGITSGNLAKEKNLRRGNYILMISNRLMKLTQCYVL